MKKYKEKKPFKREYIPVIIAVIILIGLIVSLIFVLKDNKKDFKVDIDPTISNSEDLKVDINNTKCNNDEASKLKEEANKIKVSYEVRELKVDNFIVLDEEGYPEVEGYVTGFVVNIEDISENTYVVVKNDYSDDVFTYHYADTENGKVEIESTATNELVTFTVDVKSENESCKDETYRKMTLSTPIYNSYSNIQYCNENPDLDVCNQFVLEKVSSEDFDKAKQQNEKLKEEKEEKNKTNFIKDNKYVFIIGGCVVIFIGVATALVQIKKRRSR